MKSLRRFLLRVVNLVSRRTQDERLREEIEEHIALQTEEIFALVYRPVRHGARPCSSLAASSDETRLSSPSEDCHLSKICWGIWRNAGSNDSPHAGACSGDHRFVGHRNWREYNDLFLDSMILFQPLPGVSGASNFLLVELRTETGGYPGASWPEYRALQTQSAGATGHRGLSDGAVQRREKGQTERTFGQTCLGQLFFCAGIEACHRRFIRPEEAERPELSLSL